MFDLPQTYQEDPHKVLIMQSRGDEQGRIGRKLLFIVFLVFYNAYYHACLQTLCTHIHTYNYFFKITILGSNLHKPEILKCQKLTILYNYKYL